MQSATKTTITMSERIATAHVTTEGKEPITGDVKFVRDGQPLGTSPVENGQAQHPIYGSTDRLLAVYEGDENNAQSISKFWDQSVPTEEDKPFAPAPLTHAEPASTNAPFLSGPIPAATATGTPFLAPAEPAHV